MGSLIGLAAVAGFVWFLLRRRRKQRALQLEAQKQKDMAPVYPELDPNASQGLDRVKGGEGALRYAPFRLELDGERRVHELLDNDGDARRLSGR